MKNFMLSLFQSSLQIITEYTNWGPFLLISSNFGITDFTVCDSVPQWFKKIKIYAIN